jgi:hypothetical protein
MFTIEQIESLFGQEARKYLQNKNRGGINGERKNTYDRICLKYVMISLFNISG